jgi:hypothetical protein
MPVNLNEKWPQKSKYFEIGRDIITSEIDSFTDDKI